MSTLPSREPINLVLQYANQRVQTRDSLCLCVKRSMCYVTANEHDRGLLADRVALTVLALNLRLAQVQINFTDWNLVPWGARSNIVGNRKALSVAISVVILHACVFVC